MSLYCLANGQRYCKAELKFLFILILKIHLVDVPAPQTTCWWAREVLDMRDHPKILKENSGWTSSPPDIICNTSNDRMSFIFCIEAPCKKKNPHDPKYFGQHRHIADRKIDGVKNNYSVIPERSSLIWPGSAFHRKTFGNLKIRLCYSYTLFILENVFSIFFLFRNSCSNSTLFIQLELLYINILSSDFFSALTYLSL